MPNSNNYTHTSIEFAPFYNQVRHDYENAKGLVHGVMKDSIQNSFGHKTDKRHAKNWGMEFELIENSDQTLLTITDYGTTGLIGLIYDDIDDRNVVTSELRADPDQKLARFERLLNIGTNVEGAGGSKGRGALTYQFNSDENKIMWDSLRPDGKYVANIRIFRNGVSEQKPGPRVDKAAHEFIYDKAGLQPVDKVGTRITIFSPSKELIAAIKDGPFAKYIGDTWFELLGIYGQHIDGIFINVNGGKTKVELPEHWKKYFNNEYDEHQQFIAGPVDVRFNYADPDTGINYPHVTARAAKMVYLLADKDLDEDQKGVVVNRSFMAINQLHPILNQLDLPADKRNKVFGFVKLESSPVSSTGKSYEEMIKVTEDNVHYSFGTRNIFTNLKRRIIEGGEEFKRNAGIVSTSATHVARRRRMAASRAQNDVNTYLNDLGVGGAGPGTGGSKFIISLEKINYPQSTNMVLIGDTVDDIAFKIKNRTPNNKTVKLVIDVLDRDRHNTIQIISSNEEILLNAHTVETSQLYNLDLTPDIYNPYNYSKIYLRATIKDNNGNNLSYKLVPLNLGIEPEESSYIPIVLYEPLNLPNDNKRVNIGDRIEDVNCLVKNETDFDWELKLKVFVYDCISETVIETLIDHTLAGSDETFLLTPQTEMSFAAGDITFDEDKYGHIDEGKLELRARIISAIPQHEFPLGHKLSKRNQSLWLNMDPPGKGLFKVECIEKSPTKPRCKVSGDNGSRTLSVNISHPSFTELEEVKEEAYIAELCLFEGIKYCWENNYGGPFDVEPSDEISFSDAFEEISNAYDKGLGHYYGG